MSSFRVVAKLDGQRFNVETFATYDAAIARWQTLDGALRANRLVILGPIAYRNIPTGRLVADRQGNYLAVRDSLDPQWSSSPTVKLAALRKGRGHGKADGAIKVVGNERGVHGHPGGWLYTGARLSPRHRPGVAGRRSPDGCHLTNYQGWSSWWMGRGDLTSIVSIDHRYFLQETQS